MPIEVIDIVDDDDDDDDDGCRVNSKGGGEKKKSADAIHSSNIASSNNAATIDLLDDDTDNEIEIVENPFPKHPQQIVIDTDGDDDSVEIVEQTQTQTQTQTPLGPLDASSRKRPPSTTRVKASTALNESKTINKTCLQKKKTVTSRKETSPNNTSTIDNSNSNSSTSNRNQKSPSNAKIKLGSPTMPPKLRWPGSNIAAPTKMKTANAIHRESNPTESRVARKNNSQQCISSKTNTPSQFDSNRVDSRGGAQNHQQRKNKTTATTDIHINAHANAKARACAVAAAKDRIPPMGKRKRPHSSHTNAHDNANARASAGAATKDRIPPMGKRKRPHPSQQTNSLNDSSRESLVENKQPWRKKNKKGTTELDDPLDVVLSKEVKEYLATIKITTAAQLLLAKTTDVARNLLEWRKQKGMAELRGRAGSAASVSVWKRKVRLRAALVGAKKLAELNQGTNIKPLGLTDEDDRKPPPPNHCVK